MIRPGTLIAVGVLVGLTVISGVVDGRFTRRWGTPPDLAVAGQRLRNILEPQDATDPLSPRKGEQKIGDWEFKGEEKLSKEVVEILQQNSGLKLEIEGHTSNMGDFNANMKLSNERAQEVKNYLVSKGIDASRLNAVGYGPTRPITDSKSAE